MAGLVRPLFASSPRGRVSSPGTLARPRRGLSPVFHTAVPRLQPVAVLRFIQTRHLQSQMLLGDGHRLVFLTSMPYTYGKTVGHRNRRSDNTLPPVHPAMA
jgi:hypothetical protein